MSKETFCVQKEPGTNGRFLFQFPGNTSQNIIREFGCTTITFVHQWPNIVVNTNDSLSVWIDAAETAISVPVQDYSLAELLVVLNDALPAAVRFSFSSDTNLVTLSNDSAQLVSIDNSTLAKQLGFVDVSTSNAAIVGTSIPDIRLSALYSHLVVCCNQLERLGRLQYRDLADQERRIWFTVPMGCAKQGDVLEYTVPQEQMEGTALYPNTSSCQIEFYWSNGDVVDFTTHSVSMECYTLQ